MANAGVDRASLVRRAIVELVADTGIHGATMSQVAQRAGVATGTAYVHYESKEHLLIAAFVEIKQCLGTVATSGLDLSRNPAQIFATVWRRIYRHLRDDPSLARFLTQLDESPLRRRAHEALADDDPLTRLATEMTPHLVELPVEVLYELGLAPAVRLAASAIPLDDSQLGLVEGSCWRAIARR